MTYQNEMILTDEQRKCIDKMSDNYLYQFGLINEWSIPNVEAENYRLSMENGYDHYTRILPNFRTANKRATTLNIVDSISHICKPEKYMLNTTKNMMRFIDEFVRDNFTMKDKERHFNHSGVAVAVILLHMMATFLELKSGPFIVEKDTLDEYRCIIGQITDTPTNHINNLLNQVEIGFHNVNLKQVFENMVGHYQMFFVEMQKYLPRYVSEDPTEFKNFTHHDESCAYYKILLYVTHAIN